MMNWVKKGGRIVAILGLGVVIGVTTPAIAEPLPIPTADTSTQSSTVIAPDELVLNKPIIDKAGILTDGEKSHLESQLRKIYDDKLAQMAIVIVPTTGGMDIFDYTYQTAKRWGLGNKNDNDGILMVVAIHDRKLHIVTGYGVEGVLPDVAIKRIIREDITPSFKTEAYAQGLSAGIARIDERLRADPEMLAKMDTRQDDDESEPALPFLIFFGIVFGNILISMLGRMVGATLATIGIGVLGGMMGLSPLAIVIGCVVVWLFVVFGFGKNIRINANNGSVYVGGSRIDRNTHRGSGFGSGGFRGGGGSFGGGGAGGSW